MCIKGKKLRENGASFRKKYDLFLIFVTVVSRFLPVFVPIESGEKRKNKRYNRRVKRRWKKRSDNAAELASKGRPPSVRIARNAKFHKERTVYKTTTS